MPGSIVPNPIHISTDGLRQQVKRTIAYIPTASHDKFVQVRLKPLLPLILATSALVYHEGQQKKLAQANNTDVKSSWQGVVAESTLGYLLLKYTTGVYPLMGLGLSIYRASQQNNALDQLKAVITTVVTMGMGFIGANLLDPHLLERMENNKLKKLLETEGEAGTHLHHWIETLKSHPEADPLKELGQHLSELKHKLTVTLPDLEQQGFKSSAQELKALHEEIGELKSHLAEKISSESGVNALAHVDSGAEHLAQKLFGYLAESQSVLTKVTRAANPVCCVMFSAFLLGTPLANWINGHLERRHPDLKKKAMKQVLFPDSQRILKLPESSEKESGHHLYQPNPGPYISCPEVANGRPLQ